MTKPKSNRGGKRPGAGRKVGYRKPDARVLLTAKVLPSTKNKIDAARGDLSVGKLLDKLVEPLKNR